MRFASRLPGTMHFLSLMLCLLFTRPAQAQLTETEKRVLGTLDASRVKNQLRYLSEGVVKTKSGAGAGTAVAGSPEEATLAQAVAEEMSKIGLDVHKETYPVRRYSSGPVTLTANGVPVQAISLHAAGGTW